MKKSFKIYPILCLIFVTYCLIGKAEFIKAEIILALKTWATILMPAVFPYLVISNMILSSDIISRIIKIPSLILSKIFNISSESSVCILASFICGYPSGAICASELYKKGRIGLGEAKRLILFTNNAGPLFVISAIGISIFYSLNHGIAIYVIQHISAAIYGIILRFGNESFIGSSRTYKSESIDICDAVRKSVNTSLNICGFMVCAYVINACAYIFFDMLITNRSALEFMTTITKGFTEITSGVYAVVKTKNKALAFASACAFVSWSGMSVILQIKSVAGDIISYKELIKAKLCQGTASFILGYIYISIYGNEITRVNYSNALRYSFMVSVILFIVYALICLKRKIKASGHL